MEIGQLRAFVVAAREKSFTRAAELLSVTQPSVTARIQTLENELKLSLFLRKGRSIALTDGGKVFLPYAERTLMVLDEAEEAVRNVREGTAGRFSIGAIQTICSNLIAPVLDQFHRECPQVEIFLRSGHSNLVVEMLLDDVVQLGVAIGPIAHQQIRTLFTFHDELVVIASPEHPFARQRDKNGNIIPVGVKELSAQDFVVVRWGSTYDLFLSRLRDASQNPRISMEIGVTDTAKAMVRANAGISIMPRFAAANEIHSGALVEVPVVGLQSTFIEISAIQRIDRALSMPARHFMELWVSSIKRTIILPDSPTNFYDMPLDLSE